MNLLNQKVCELIQQSVQEYIQKISNKYDLDETELLAMWNNIDNDTKKSATKKSATKKSETKKSETKKSETKKSEDDLEKESEDDLEKESDDESDKKSLSSDNGKGCPYVFTKGSLSGKECGCIPKNGAIYCSKHKKYEGNEPKNAKKVLPTPKKSVVPAQAKKISPLPKTVSIVLRKNKSLGDKLWHADSGMVFKSAVERVVIGKNVDDKVEDLTEEDIEICKSLNFRYETKDDVKDDVKEVSHQIKSVLKGKDASDMKKSINKAINNTNSQVEDVEDILSKLNINKKGSYDYISDEDEMEEIDEDEMDDEIEEEY